MRKFRLARPHEHCSLGHFVTMMICFFFLNIQVIFAQENSNDTSFNQVAYAMKYTANIPVDTGFFSTFMFPAESDGQKINLPLALVEAVRKGRMEAYFLYFDERLDSLDIEKSLGFCYDTVIVSDPYDPRSPDCEMIISGVADPASITHFRLEYFILYNDRKQEVKKILTGLSLVKAEYDSDKNFKGYRGCFRLKATDPELQDMLHHTASVADGSECIVFSDTIGHLNTENHMHWSEFVSFAYLDSVTGISLLVQKNELNFPEKINGKSKLVVSEILLPYTEYPDSVRETVMGNFFMDNELRADTFPFHPNQSLFGDSYFSMYEDNSLRQIMLNEISGGRIQMYKKTCLPGPNANEELFYQPMTKRSASKSFCSYYSSVIGTYDPDTIKMYQEIGDTIIFSPVFISRYEILELHSGDLVVPIAILPGYARYSDDGDFIEYKMLGWIPFSVEFLNTLNHYEAFNPGLFQQMTFAEYFNRHLYQGKVISECPIEQRDWDRIRDKFLR